MSIDVQFHRQLKFCFCFYLAWKDVSLKHVVQTDGFLPRLSTFKIKLVFCLGFMDFLMGICCLQNLSWLFTIMLILLRDGRVGKEKWETGERRPCKGGGREKGRILDLNVSQALFPGSPAAQTHLCIIYCFFTERNSSYSGRGNRSPRKMAVLIVRLI